MLAIQIDWGGLSLHANPRRETAFYSPSTRKATLCLLCLHSIIGSFLALSLLSPAAANCNDLFLLISSNFQPTHLKKKPFVLPKKGSRELKYTVIMHTHLCSHFVYTNTDASFVFSCKPENISVRVLLSTFSYVTFLTTFITCFYPLRLLTSIYISFIYLCVILSYFSSFFLFGV